MSLVLDIDPESQKALEQAFGGDLSRRALEALAADGYRMGKLTGQGLRGRADARC